MMYFSIKRTRKIRYSVLLCLIFSILLMACREQKNESDISIYWENNKATGITIPEKLLKNVPPDSIRYQLHIQRAGRGGIPSILGTYDISPGIILFRPLIPFTPGLHYEVRVKDQLIGGFSIPSGNTLPSVITVFPGADTLPENLLKIYIGFSDIMQQGTALEHVCLVRNGNDTLRDVFLDMQPELWSNDGKRLTLWLDPGRIKRDLQPNINMGPPLKKGEQLRLVIQQNWKGSSGDSLAKPYFKEFIVGDRDDLSPDPVTWTIQTPAAGTMDSLEIIFHEPLDQVLAENSISIKGPDGIEIKGEKHTGHVGDRLYIKPGESWKAGTYTLEIESRLEDLAGNNLNRLFDQDIMDKNKREEKDIFIRNFQVQAGR